MEDIKTESNNIFSMFNKFQDFDSNHLIYNNDEASMQFEHDERQHYLFVETDQDFLFEENVPTSFNIDWKRDFINSSLLKRSEEGQTQIDAKVQKDITTWPLDVNGSSGPAIMESEITIERYATIHVNRGGRKKMTGLVQRKDVVYKTVLRNIRRYYMNNFYQITKYNIKYKYNQGREYYLGKLLAYANHEFKIDSSVKQIDVLEDLFNSKETRVINPMNEIYDAIYNFTFMKFHKIIKIPEIRFLIFHFESIVNKKEMTNDELIGLKKVLEECQKLN
jgi:hypothetical protein